MHPPQTQICSKVYDSDEDDIMPPLYDPLEDSLMTEQVTEQVLKFPMKNYTPQRSNHLLGRTASGHCWLDDPETETQVCFVLVAVKSLR